MIRIFMKPWWNPSMHPPFFRMVSVSNNAQIATIKNEFHRFPTAVYCTVNTCNHSNSTQTQLKPLFTIYCNNKFEAILSDSPARQSKMLWGKKVLDLFQITFKGGTGRGKVHTKVSSVCVTGSCLLDRQRQSCGLHGQQAELSGRPDPGWEPQRPPWHCCLPSTPAAARCVWMLETLKFWI